MHQTRTILKVTYFISLYNYGDLSIFAFKYSTAHCKYDIIVHHKNESVTSFMHKWLHVNYALWVTNRNEGYDLSMLEHDRNSQWLRGGSLTVFASPPLNH